jgi:hypothetical protein
VLIDHLLTPYIKHRSGQLPRQVWPYYDGAKSASPAELLAFMEAFDSAVEEKEGGGYRLTVAMDEVIQRARHGS